MKLGRFRKVQLRDRLRVGVILLVFVIAEVISAELLAEQYPLFWLGLIAFMVGGLVYWHSRFIGYRCGRCGNEFQINWKQEMTSLNGFNKKYVLCPKCGQRSWMEILRVRV